MKSLAFSRGLMKICLLLMSASRMMTLVVETGPLKIPLQLNGSPKVKLPLLTQILADTRGILKIRWQMETPSR